MNKKDLAVMFTAFIISFVILTLLGAMLCGVL